MFTRQKIILTINLLFTIVILLAGQPSEIVILKTKTGTLEGTLLVPEAKTITPVALIIAGSGPTDRDGNSPVAKNNALKMLASGLFKNEIASLRYDKRGVGKSKKAGLKESNLRFETYIEDANAWIDFLKNDKKFGKIIIIGHSEGGLIGIIISQRKDVDKFISLAGAGQSADKLLKEQLKSQPPMIVKMSSSIIDKLVNGETDKNVNPVLYSLFRPSIQRYMISWFRYDPQKEIAKLKKPILVIQGTTDIQVSQNAAALLTKANNKAEKIIIEGMNHILKKAKPERLKNIQTYNQPELPLHPELVKPIVEFIKK